MTTAAQELVARGRVKPPAIKTRKPTALPVWPLTLAAAVQGAGKSFSAAEASNSPLVGHTYAMEIGEASLDPYGAMVDLNRFDLVEHDGTYADIASQVWAMVSQPRVVPDKPNLIVLDGGSGMWDLLVNENQIVANERARKYNKPIGPDGADISPDLWNAAKKKWLAIIDLLKSHDGPVIVTARLNEVAIFDGKAPKKDGSKEWKAEVHKSFPFDVDIMLEAHAIRSWKATKTRSLTFQIPEGGDRPIPQFTFDKLWRELGIEEGTKTARRQFTAQNAAAGAAETNARESGELTPDQWLAAIAGAEVAQTIYAMHARAKAVGQLELVIEGQKLEERMRVRAEELKKAGAEDQAAVDKAAAEKRGEEPAPTGAGAVVVAARRRLATPDQPAEAGAAAEETVDPAVAAAAEEAAVEALLAEAEQRGMLVDELKMISGILGYTVEKITERTLPMGVEDAPIATLQKVTANLRPMTVKKLGQLGRHGEAVAYAKVKENEYDTEANLLGREPEAADVQADKAV